MLGLSRLVIVLYVLCFMLVLECLCCFVLSVLMSMWGVFYVVECGEDVGDDVIWN